MLLRFWSLIFPPSDLRHPVMTPAILFMSEVLCRCPITSGRDVAVGSFFCTLLLSVSPHRCLNWILLMTLTQRTVFDLKSVSSEDRITNGIYSAGLQVLSDSIAWLSMNLSCSFETNNCVCLTSQAGGNKIVFSSFLMWIYIYIFLYIPCVLTVTD